MAWCLRAESTSLQHMRDRVQGWKGLCRKAQGCSRSWRGCVCRVMLALCLTKMSVPECARAVCLRDSLSSHQCCVKNREALQCNCHARPIPRATETPRTHPARSNVSLVYSSFRFLLTAFRCACARSDRPFSKGEPPLTRLRSPRSADEQDLP